MGRKLKNTFFSSDENLVWRRIFSNDELHIISKIKHFEKFRQLLNKNAYYNFSGIFRRKLGK